MSEKTNEIKEKVRKDWEEFMKEPLNRAIFERLSRI